MKTDTAVSDPANPFSGKTPTIVATVTSLHVNVALPNRVSCHLDQIRISCSPPTGSSSTMSRVKVVAGMNDEILDGARSVLSIVTRRSAESESCSKFVTATETTTGITPRHSPICGMIVTIGFPVGIATRSISKGSALFVSVPMTTVAMPAGATLVVNSTIVLSVTECLLTETTVNSTVVPSAAVAKTKTSLASATLGNCLT